MYTPEEIPPTWLKISLGDVVNYGSALKAEPIEIANDTWVLELEDIEKNSSRVLQKVRFSERQSKSTKNKFEAGDVLYGKLRPYLNKVVYADEAGVCTTEIVPIKGNQAINSKYLFYWLKHPVFINYVTEVSHGVNMPRLGTDAGKQAPLVLAPRGEQRRIADKLDTTLARVDALNDRMARITHLLKRFRQSVLAAATSGRLTEKWREERGLNTSWQVDSTYGDLPECWNVLDIDKIKSEAKYSLAIGPFGSNLKTTHYTDAGVPLVFVREIRARSFGGNKTKFVSLKKADDLKAHKVTGGDILITKMGDPPGDVAIYPCDKEDAVITADCIKLKINKKIANNSYISFALESPSFKSVFMTAVAGVAQQKVSLARFRELPIVVPPLDEQTEIVRRVETLFAFADRLEARLQSAQTAAERLTPALLAKAFRGELVPQDPNDEPAAELLRRLHEARAAEAPTKPKRGRKAAPPVNA